MEQYFRLVELSRPGHQISSFARKYEIKWVLEINDVLGEDDTVQYNFSRRNLLHQEYNRSWPHFT